MVVRKSNFSSRYGHGFVFMMPTLKPRRTPVRKTAGISWQPEKPHGHSEHTSFRGPVIPHYTVPALLISSFKTGDSYLLEEKGPRWWEFAQTLYHKHKHVSPKHDTKSELFSAQSDRIWKWLGTWQTSTFCNMRVGRYRKIHFIISPPSS